MALPVHGTVAFLIFFFACCCLVVWCCFSICCYLVVYFCLVICGGVVVHCSLVANYCLVAHIWLVVCCCLAICCFIVLFFLLEVLFVVGLPNMKATIYAHNKKHLKQYILYKKDQSTLNTKRGLINMCRHKKSFLLSNWKNHPIEPHEQLL